MFDKFQLCILQPNTQAVVSLVSCIKRETRMIAISSQLFAPK